MSDLGRLSDRLRGFQSETLRAHGLRSTLARVFLYQVLAEAAERDEQLSVKEIYAQCLAENVDASMSTVQRVLSELERVGLVEKTGQGELMRLYALADRSARRFRASMVDATTGNVVEFTDEVLQKRVEELAAQRGFSVSRQTLTVIVDKTESQSIG